MHVHSPICQRQLIEKKIWPIYLIVWVLGRVKKALKGVRKMKKIFFCFKQISKCNTCFYIHFSRAFQKNRYVALVTKKLWAILDFFTDFFSALYQTLCIKKKFYKKSFKLLFIKSFTMIVSKMRVLGQKNYIGGAKRPPSLLWLNNATFYNLQNAMVVAKRWKHNHQIEGLFFKSNKQFISFV